MDRKEVLNPVQIVHKSWDHLSMWYFLPVLPSKSSGNWCTSYPYLGASWIGSAHLQPSSQLDLQPNCLVGDRFSWSLVRYQTRLLCNSRNSKLMLPLQPEPMWVYRRCCSKSAPQRKGKDCLWPNCSKFRISGLLWVRNAIPTSENARYGSVRKFKSLTQKKLCWDSII